MKRLMCFFFLFIFIFSIDCRASQLTLVQGSTRRVLTDAQLSENLHLNRLEVDDPVYHKHKHYAGYWLSDILAYAGMHLDQNTAITFTALDGFKAGIDTNDIMRSGAKAFIATQDMDNKEGWEEFQDGKELVSPGPYYLVWQIPTQGVPSGIKLQWPYQIAEISIRNSDETEQILFPESYIKPEPVTRGYKVFTQNCMTCHSINLQGGAVGPELNVPKNITEYESRDFLKQFISDPSSFRARSRMPSFNKILTPQEIEDVLNYLAWMEKHKIP